MFFNFIIFVSVIMFLIFIFYYLSISSKVNDKQSNNHYSCNYEKKMYLSKSEKIFMDKLLSIENILNVKVVPQVCLSAVINKVDSDIPFHNELYRIVDFGIFSSDYCKPLLLIELNDSSHNDRRRNGRDDKVHEICEKAGIKLITFYTNMPNEEEYIINRINNCLSKKEDI